MAKDGTRRGGARVGAGRKRKALTDKINDGQTAEVLDTPADLSGEEMPAVKDYLTARQKNGKDLIAGEIYSDTCKWLKARGCETAVYGQLIEQYAMSVARWLQCEEAISEYGFLAKHPTTGAPIASPYVSMSQSYMKQVNTVWEQIFRVVRENCSTEFTGTPMDNAMEMLLQIREGHR